MSPRPMPICPPTPRALTPPVLRSWTRRASFWRGRPGCPTSTARSWPRPVPRAARRLSLIDVFAGPENQASLGFAAAIYGVQADPGSAMPIGYVVGIRRLAPDLWTRLSQPGDVAKTGQTYLVRRSGASIEFLSPLADGAAPLSRMVAADTPGLAGALCHRFSRRLQAGAELCRYRCSGHRAQAYGRALDPGQDRQRRGSPRRNRCPALASHCHARALGDGGGPRLSAGLAPCGLGAACPDRGRERAARRPPGPSERVPQARHRQPADRDRRRGRRRPLSLRQCPRGRGGGRRLGGSRRQDPRRGAGARPGRASGQDQPRGDRDRRDRHRRLRMAGRGGHATRQIRPYPGRAGARRSRRAASAC